VSRPSLRNSPQIKSGSKLTPKTIRQIETMRRLFTLAESKGIPLWLENGWAIDARLGYISRAHGDIDIVYPIEKKKEYIQIIRRMGFREKAQHDYGFEMAKDGIVLDSEGCIKNGRNYGFGNFPKGCCPNRKDGSINNFKVRCTSWAANYYEYLGYFESIPKHKWRKKDFESFKIVHAHLSVKTKKALEKEYQKQHR
jgi:2''-aminoglycoside nucleotidyltransferase